MKRLIVCFDGTWNNADNPTGETNVTRISRAVRANSGADGVPQTVLYLRGVGTTGLDINKWFEGGTGYGIDDNIRSAYMFLAQNYLADEDDEIFLFGFSRGAFSARSLVGLIASAGLLYRQSLGALANAWDYYRTDRPHDPVSFLKQAPPGTQTHADVPIAFLGVWDTVGALGVPGQLFATWDRKLYGFHDTGISRNVRIARHALAIDEHRDPFVPTFWTGDTPPGADIKQVWFAGVHADVGGSYASASLSNIPLLWMAREAAAAGLQLDASCLPTAADCDPLGPQHDSSKGIFKGSHFVPTEREMCGRSFPVPFYQRLYAPTDENHHPLITINEAVHASVLTRLNQSVTMIEDEGDPAKGEPPTQHQLTYKPPNLAALLGPNGSIDPTIAIEP